MSDQKHEWAVVHKKEFTNGLIETERCHKCNATRTIQYPPGMKIDTQPKPLPRFCPGMQTEPNPIIRQRIRNISSELTEAEIERLEKDNDFVTNLLEADKVTLSLIGGLVIHMTFPYKAESRFRVR